MFRDGTKQAELEAEFDELDLSSGILAHHGSAPGDGLPWGRNLSPRVSDPLLSAGANARPPASQTHQAPRFRQDNRPIPLCISPYLKLVLFRKWFKQVSPTCACFVNTWSSHTHDERHVLLRTTEYIFSLKMAISIQMIS